MNHCSCPRVGKILSLSLEWFCMAISMRQNSRDVFTYLGKTLLGLSLIGGGLGLFMDGSLTLVGGLLLRSLISGLSSVKQIHHIILLFYYYSFKRKMS